MSSITKSTVKFLDLGYTRATDSVYELGNHIGDEGALCVATMLKENTNIRGLNLLHNGISQVGVNYIISALEVNRTLCFIQLTQFRKVHNEPGKEYIRTRLQENYDILSLTDKTNVDEILNPPYINDIYSVYRTKK